MSVVVGVEGKQPATVRFAADAATARNAALRVVHCIEGLDTTSVSDDTIEFSDDLWPAPGQDVLDAAREVIECMESPPPTSYLLSSLRPDEQLLEEASAASLVVVGTDAIGRMQRPFDGTVSQYLVHHCPVPVAIVPELSRPASPGTGVFLALDARTQAVGPIWFAFDEADQRNSELYAVHVTTAALTPARTASLRTEIAELLAGWPQRYPDVKLTRRLMPGKADEGCLRASEEAEILVVGRGNHSMLATDNHPVLTQIARRAHCPCVVVPDSWCPNEGAP